MNIFRVGLHHVDEVANLFDQYRQFYEKSADPEGCRRFIGERLANNESVIFAANLAPEARRQGVAKALMDAARQHAIQRRAGRLQLETAVDNLAAQTLYESLGWKRDEAFDTYHLELRAL